MQTNGRGAKEHYEAGGEEALLAMSRRPGKLSQWFLVWVNFPTIGFGSSSKESRESGTLKYERNGNGCYAIRSPGQGSASEWPSGKHLMRYLPILLLLAACATSAPPSVPDPIEDFYRTNYPSKPSHKAFVLATGASGYASGYSYGYLDSKEAIASAMRVCNERKATHNVDEACRLYAVDDFVVWGKSDEEIEALNNSNHRLFYNRGLAYRDKGDYDRAIENYDKDLRINPEDANAYYSRGVAYHGKGDYKQAIRDYDEAIRINREDANAYNSRGVAYHGKGDYDQAIQDYDEAIRINPADANAYNNRCWTYGLMHRPDEALRDCNESQRLRPDNVPTLDSRALAYWLRGDEGKAREDLERARMIDPLLPAWQERFREFEEMF